MRSPKQIWARSVQPFIRLLDKNKQTDKQSIFKSSKVYTYIDIITDYQEVSSFIVQ